MSRVIKFRAWDKKLNKMFYFDQFFVSTNRAALASEYGLSSWDNCEAMQFTGLLDRNGKEIYEGDIVEFMIENEFSSINTLVTQVVFENGGFGFDSSLPIQRALEAPEIIGSIYENPELLK